MAAAHLVAAVGPRPEEGWPAGHTLITGAGGRLGRELALRAARGDRLASICDRDPEALAATAERCRAGPGKVVSALLDVRDRAALAEWTRERHAARPLECVVASAALVPTRPEDPALARELTEVNVTGTLNTVTPAVECMAASGRGTVVLISSLSAVAGFPRVPAYAASKAAVRAYGRSIRLSIRRRGLRLLIVSPGFFDVAGAPAQGDARPSLLTAERVATRIERALRGRRTEISFPWPLAMAASILSTLPGPLADLVYRHWLESPADRLEQPGTK